jgi:hypothetical protein
MKRKAISIFVIIGAVYFNSVSAQDCSDAGICTIHSIKDNTQAKEASRKNELAFGFSFGKGEDDVSYYTPSIDYTRELGHSTSFTAKLDYSAIHGHLANTSGIGDLFLSVDKKFDRTKIISKSVIAGLKIPFDHADAIKNGIELPMPYQTSLGTFDAIAGVNFYYKSFGATFAVQQPLTKANQNGFLVSDYSSNPFASKYLSSNQLKRKGDAFTRLSYNRKISQVFSLRPSLLCIYHFSNDNYLDEAKLRKEITGSKGLTLNGNLFFDFKLSAVSEIEIGVRTPFIIRQARPDGLTRSLVSVAEYKIHFD